MAQRAEGDEGSSSERPGDPLRDVMLPALLAIAIMLAVWWAWRVLVVDVGTQANPEPNATAPGAER